MIIRSIKTISFFIIIFYLNSCFAQMEGKLIGPNIPFPKEITGKLKGYIIISYQINGYGKIKSFDLMDIVTVENDQEKCLYSNKKLPFHDISRNTKLGNSIAKKLKSFVSEVGSKTKFEATKLPKLKAEKAEKGFAEYWLTIYFGYSDKEMKEMERAKQKTIEEQKKIKQK